MAAEIAVAAAATAAVVEESLRGWERPARQLYEKKLSELSELFDLVNPKKSYQRWPPNPNNFIRVMEFSKKREAMFLVSATISDSLFPF